MGAKFRTNHKPSAVVSRVAFLSLATHPVSPCGMECRHGLMAGISEFAFKTFPKDLRAYIASHFGWFEDWAHCSGTAPMSLSFW